MLPALVQDLGRPGHARLGVAPSGDIAPCHRFVDFRAKLGGRRAKVEERYPKSKGFVITHIILA